MAYCKKCGAYIPIDETTCPACGYDPVTEAQQAQAAAAAAKQAEEDAKRAEENKKAQEQRSWAAEEMRREREAEARRRAEEQRRREQNKKTSGPYQTQYTSQRTGQSSAAQGQTASERTGWAPPWAAQSQSGNSSQRTAYDYEQMRTQAQESVENQRLSVLSYLGPLMVIPLVLRSGDDFARYHSNQGLVLLLASGVGSMVAGILGSELISAAVSIFGLYCTVKGIMNVIRGKKEPLPFIGGIKLLK